MPSGSLISSSLILIIGWDRVGAFWDALVKGFNKAKDKADGFVDNKGTIENQNEDEILLQCTYSAYA